MSPVPNTAVQHTHVVTTTATARMRPIVKDSTAGVHASASRDTSGYESLEIGVSGVPAKYCDLILGSMYALKASTSSARFALFVSILFNAIRAGRPCFLITASKPDEFLARLDKHWAMQSNDLIAGGQLKVFSTQAEVTKKIFRYGADRFVQELSTFGVAQNALVIYDQADDLLSLHDPFLARQQVEVLARWFQSNQVTTLLSFSKPSERQSDTFNTLMDYFTGIARLGGDRDGLELTFVYWKGSAGVTVARNFSLVIDDEGQYKAKETIGRTKPNHSPFTASEQTISDRRSESFNDKQSARDSEPTDCTLYNDPGLDNLLIGVPGTPIRVSHVEEIIANASLHPRAMILLNTGGIPDLRKTAQVVHTLRVNLSDKIQIVVYGKLPEFSMDESQLLLRCGANAVLKLDVLQTNLGQTIASMKRQIFLRAVDQQFDSIWDRYALEQSSQAQDTSDLNFDAPLEKPTDVEAHRFKTGTPSTLDSLTPAPRSNAKAKRSSFA